MISMNLSDARQKDRERAEIAAAPHTAAIRRGMFFARSEWRWEMNSTSFLRDTLDNIIDLSMQIGALQSQRTYKMYGPQDAVIEHGLRQSLYEKKQKLLETTTENWQPIITIGNVDLWTEQVDVWSTKHGRITDVAYGKETYGKRVGIVYQSDYDCDGPVLEIVTDATHWMIVKGPIE